MVAGAGIGALGSLIGGTAANEANAEQAAMNRDWQTAMTTAAQNYDWMKQNTKYQVQAADMKKAGLNPLLMMGHGATTSGTAPQPGSVGNPVMQNVLGDAITSAGRAVEIANTLRRSDADIALTNAQATSQAATALRETNTATKTSREIQVLDHLMGATKAEGQYRETKAALDKSTAETQKVLDLIGQTTGIASNATGAITDIMNAFSLKGLKGLFTKKPTPAQFGGPKGITLP